VLESVKHRCADALPCHISARFRRRRSKLDENFAVDEDRTRALLPDQRALNHHGGGKYSHHYR